MSAAPSAGMSRPTSTLTASKTSDGVTPCATRVATRRSAACSSASRVSSSRAWLFARAVDTSSVNSASRSSIRSGSGASGDEVVITPQTRPSTMIGAPAALRYPPLRARVGIVPGRSEYSSIRAGRPVRRTSADIDGPSSGQREPTRSTSGPSPQAARTVTAVPSSSKRLTAAFERCRTWAASRATAANSSVDDAPLATSVATRRRAACSSTS